MYRYYNSQVVPISVNQAWDFFASPKNLERLTPPNMHLNMIDTPNEEMYEGMIMRYLVAPLWGIRVPWSAEITKIVKGRYFVDHMIEGPFSLWHHQHFFNQTPQGTKVSDLIHYKVPLGFFGKLFHPLLVKKEMQNLFAFREDQLEQIFGNIEVKEA